MGTGTAVQIWSWVMCCAQMRNLHRQQQWWCRYTISMRSCWESPANELETGLSIWQQIIYQAVTPWGWDYRMFWVFMICLPSYLAHFLFIQLPCGMTVLGRPNPPSNPPIIRGVTQPLLRIHWIPTSLWPSMQSHRMCKFWYEEPWLASCWNEGTSCKCECLRKGETRQNGLHVHSAKPSGHFTWSVPRYHNCS